MTFFIFQGFTGYLWFDKIRIYFDAAIFVAGKDGPTDAVLQDFNSLEALSKCRGIWQILANGK